LPGRGKTPPRQFQSNEKQIGLGFAHYTQDYDEKLPAILALHSGFWLWIRMSRAASCSSAPATPPHASGALTTSNISYGYNWVYLATISIASITTTAETIMVAETGKNVGNGTDHYRMWRSGT